MGTPVKEPEIRTVPLDTLVIDYKPEPAKTSLVGFFDILGTKAAVRKRRFDDYCLLDFANPVGIAAHKYTALRFAVFSDSVIVSCDATFAAMFVAAVHDIFEQWTADHIFVRGGISVGDIRWVDHPSDQRWFGKLRNFSYCRVYGGALVDAVEMEGRSGPGVLCFLTENAAAVLSKVAPHSYISAASHILIPFPERTLAAVAKTMEFLLSRAGLDEEEKKHLSATVRLLKTRP